MFKPDLTYEKADLLASLIEEEDWSASLGETLYQIARRVERADIFLRSGRTLVDTILTKSPMPCGSHTGRQKSGAVTFEPSVEAAKAGGAS